MLVAVSAVRGCEHMDKVRIDSEKMKKLMKERGISQVDLSRLLNVTQGAVSHYMSGRNNPEMGSWLAIADVLGCRVEDLCIVDSSDD